MARSRSRKYLEPDARGRLALGPMLHHDMYLAQLHEGGIITLTPAEVTPLTSPPPVRKRRIPTRPGRPAGAGEQEGDTE